MGERGDDGKDRVEPEVVQRSVFREVIVPFHGQQASDDGAQVTDSDQSEEDAGGAQGHHLEAGRYADDVPGDAEQHGRRLEQSPQVDERGTVGEQLFPQLRRRDVVEIQRHAVHAEVGLPAALTYPAPSLRLAYAVELCPRVESDVVLAEKLCAVVDDVVAVKHFSSLLFFAHALCHAVCKGSF